MSPTSFSFSIPSGSEFKEWRSCRGWSIQKTAEMLNYQNVSAIYQIESGIRKVPRRVAAMMEFYDVTMPVEGGRNEGNSTSQS